MAFRTSSCPKFSLKTYRYAIQDPSACASRIKDNEGLQCVIESPHEGRVIDRGRGSSELALEAAISVCQDVLLLVVLPNVVDVGDVDVVLEADVGAEVFHEIRLIVDGQVTIRCGRYFPDF